MGRRDHGELASGEGIPVRRTTVKRDGGMRKEIANDDIILSVCEKLVVRNLLSIPCSLSVGLVPGSTSSRPVGASSI